MALVTKSHILQRGSPQVKVPGISLENSLLRTRMDFKFLWFENAVTILFSKRLPISASLCKIFAFFLMILTTLWPKLSYGTTSGILSDGIAVFSARHSSLCTFNTRSFADLTTGSGYPLAWKNVHMLSTWLWKSSELEQILRKRNIWEYGMLFVHAMGWLESYRKYAWESVGL